MTERAGSAAARFDGPITVGLPSRPIDPRPVDLGAIGYVEEEWFASGTARAFGEAGPLSADGRWELEALDAAPYSTRLTVRRPADPARFDGTVMVEWLNVSTLEAAPEWAYVGDVMVERGAVWVGLSVQARGIVGGEALVRAGGAEAGGDGGVKGRNPERYGSLHHPGDRFSFDIYAQVAAALRSQGGARLVGGTVRTIVAAGQSQSAGFLTTYVNGFQPRTGAYDGFFIHSRGSGAARLDGAPALRADGTGYRLRDDLHVPVLVLESETDVGPILGYALARQPDGPTVRVWEIAGTAHADAYLVGSGFTLCAHLVNEGPHNLVAKAGLAALLRWIETGEEPPKVDPIETGGSQGTTIVRDEDGIARGGIRTPSVDVPTSVLTGDAPAGSDRLCQLFGCTIPFDPAERRARYGSRDAYLDRFDEALATAVRRGFVRAADRDAYAVEARAVDFDG